ncbi:hypothetical protein TNCV_2995911 [Trichonephila clavipes]|nr:hypothetical protein TNCV_2995911 [Trichonephila clavipes]
MHAKYIEAQTPSRWGDVEVRRGATESGVNPPLDHGSKLRVASGLKSLTRVSDGARYFEPWSSDGDDS